MCVAGVGAGVGEGAVDAGGSLSKKTKKAKKAKARHAPSHEERGTRTPAVRTRFESRAARRVFRASDGLQSRRRP